MNQLIPNPFATMLTMCDEADSLTPELQAKADQAHATTMALAEALTRSTYVPGNDIKH